MAKKMTLRDIFPPRSPLQPIATTSSDGTLYSIGFFRNGIPYIISKEQYESEDTCRSAILRLTNAITRE